MKTIVVVLSLLLLTGCWDRLPLKTLKLIDTAIFDRNEEKGDIELHYVITRLKTAGQGGGEPESRVIKFTGKSLVETVGKGEYSDSGPFIAINTGIYLMTKRFASNDPIDELAFLLDAPYTTVNSSIFVLDDGDSKELIKNKLEANKEFSKQLYEYSLYIKRNQLAPNINMMKFILSRNDPFGDLAVPVLEPDNAGMKLKGALLFHQGKNSGEALETNELEMLMLMLGKHTARQKLTGNLYKDNEDERNKFGYSIKNIDSKIKILNQSDRLPKVKIRVKMKINIFDMGESINIKSPDKVNRFEKELGKYLDERAAATIKTLQTANCDVLGIGKEIKAFHSNMWKNIDWRKDFSQFSIEPSFDIEILNADNE